MEKSLIISLIPSIISAIMSLITIIVSISLAIINICISKKVRKIQDKKEALNCFYYPLAIYINKIYITYQKVLKENPNFSILEANSCDENKQNLIVIYREVSNFLEKNNYYYVNKALDKKIDSMIRHIYMVIINENVEGIFTNEELSNYSVPNWKGIIIDIKNL